MNIISIDLPWKEDKKERTALAVADLNGNVKIERASDDNEMLELVRESAESGSIVLLDIPIDGCDKLGGETHFRPVDLTIARSGIAIQPSDKAEIRGKKLKKRLIKDNKEIEVYEIYPYAVYKFLWYVKEQKSLRHLNNKFDILLDNGFRSRWPPKYKREKKREKRLENMSYLYSLLTDRDIGLNFRTPLHRPDASSNLGQLGDEYDACLGAIAGIYFANNSSYACVAGDSDSGNMLLLADRWLFERLSKEVQIYKPEQKEFRI